MGDPITLSGIIQRLRRRSDCPIGMGVRVANDLPLIKVSIGARQIVSWGRKPFKEYPVPVQRDLRNWLVDATVRMTSRTSKTCVLRTDLDLPDYLRPYGVEALRLEDGPPPK